MVFRSFRSWLLCGSFVLLQVLVLGGVKLAHAKPVSFTPPATGSINQQINYQGKLMNDVGVAVPDGTYDMKFSFYTQVMGGTPTWTASGTTGVPTAIPVTVNDGLFTVLLGDTSAAGQWQNAFTTSTSWYAGALYLGVTVDADAEMIPRKTIGAVPQAFNAQQLQGMSASGTSPYTALFAINRTDTGLAADARSALDVKTQGTDPLSDYIVRFLQPSSDSSAFVSIRNDGFMLTRNLRSIYAAAGAAIHGENDSIDTNAWGGHMTTLLVGTGISASGVNGADQFASIMRYSGSSKNALCLDDSDVFGTCAYVAGASLIADGTINANQFDLAEEYTVSGEVEPGELVSFDREHPLFLKRSAGIAYDNDVMGIVSTRPGFLLGNATGSPIALAGRVPTKVSTLNGAIEIGDALTSAPIPGIAMKATGAGRVVGYALEAAQTTSTIEVFVRVGYQPGPAGEEAATTLSTSGDILLNTSSTATAGTTAADSWGVTWRGSVWNGLQALNQDFTLFNKSIDATHSALTLKSGTSTVWSVDRAGAMRVAGDVFLGGRFFPATRTGQQTDKYIFLDDTGSPSSTYIATNADGWQANTSYDFAERYYSPEDLQPGDVVVLNERGRFHVQRTSRAGDVPVGIVSTRPAFVAGAPGPSMFPIALAGRVPTRVSGIAGVISVGDPLAASTLPGVVVKAVQAGPIVGYALEGYNLATVGTIEVFVNAGWWGGSAIIMNESKLEKVGLTEAVVALPATVPKSYQGVARILAGATKVKVNHPSLGTFPLIQVTPYGKVDTQWWTDNSSDRGFEIILKEALLQDVTFSWRAEEMLPTDNQLFLSNDQSAQWDIHTGQPVQSGSQTQTQTPPSQTETLPDVTSATTTPDVATTTTPIVTTPTDEPATVEPVPPVEEPVVAPPVAEPVVQPEPAPVEEPVVTPPVDPVVTPEPTPAPSVDPTPTL